MARRFVPTVLVVAIAACTAAHGADWPCIGADPGLSKYTPDNIPLCTALVPQYVKRFYGKYTASKGNFFYGSSVVTHGGKAVIIADDRQPSPNCISFLEFDWRTGKSQARHDVAAWPFSQNTREADSHHYSNTIIWHNDGRVYMRRGGDNNSVQVYWPACDRLIPMYNRDALGTIQSNGIDATALMQIYQDLLICRYGHTFDTRDYYATGIAEACFLAPNETSQSDVLGTLKMEVGPSAPGTAGPDGVYGLSGRYGDIPKCANNVCVMAALVYNTKVPWPSNVKVWLEATDLLSGRTLWTRMWTSDTGGATGFGTSVSDYWRFLAANSGHYVFFTREGKQPVTVRSLDLRTGEETWAKPLADPLERPLLAYHGGGLYVIGRSDQYRLDINTGQEIWHTTNAWPHDKGYVLGNHDSGATAVSTQDPLYRPLVLTDDTLWFVDGDGTASSSAPSAATLVAIRTWDGQVIQKRDLRRYYSGKAAESLLVVNDLMAADGRLGVLIGVRNPQGPHVNSNGMDYQDLYVFKAAALGDVDGDGLVDGTDLMRLSAAWYTRAGSTNYDLACDLNTDGIIDVVDVLILAAHWNDETEDTAYLPGSKVAQMGQSHSSHPSTE